MIAQDEYDFDKDCEEIAKERGLMVVFPEANQLQIDIDSEEQFSEFERRWWAFKTQWNVSREDKVSASGLPNRHVYLTFRDRVFSEEERIMWQAALNDDPLRVFLNAMRLAYGVKNPSRLFEKP